MKYEFKTPPWNHQRECLRVSWDKPYFYLGLEYGTGKSFIIINNVGILFEIKKDIDALMVIAPNEVHERWVTEQIPAHLPERIPYIARVWTGSTSQKFKQSLEEFWSEKNKPKLKIFTVNIEALQSSSRAQAFCKNFLKAFSSFLTVDECFPPDTLIKTPLGYRKISSLNIGEEIINAYGIDKIVGMKKTKIEKGIKINGILCSENHPWFTLHGWKCARDIRPGDYLVETTSAMRLLRNSILSEESQRALSKILQSELFCQVEDEQRRNERKALYERKGKKCVYWIEKMVQRRRISSFRSYRAYKKPKTDVKSFVFRKNAYFYERTCSGKTWREWSRNSFTTKISILYFRRRRLGIRAYCSFRKNPRTSYPLQIRYCKSQKENMYRSRWEFSSISKTERTGQKEREKIKTIRVESVEVLERGNPEMEKYRGSDGFIYFYDIKAERHPSFTVNECLVHNSTRIKTPGSNRTKFVLNHLAPLAKYRRTLSGNEITRSPFDVYSPYEALKKGFWLPLPNFHAFKHRYGEWKKNQIFRKSCKVEMRCPTCNNSIKEISIKRLSTTFAVCSSCSGVIRSEYLPSKARKLVESSGKFEYPTLLRYKNLEELRAKTSYCSFIARKETCMDLPEKIYQPIYAEMNSEQKRIYAELKKDLYTKYKDVELTVINKIALSVRFQQVVGGFFPESEEQIGENNPKIDRLLYDLEDIDTDAPIIVWSCFVVEIKKIAEVLKKVYPNKRVETFFGETAKVDRKKILDDFQEGKIGFFVANTSVGGTGLNLQKAYIQYFFSNSFKAEDRWQAEDRIHRGGQTHSCLYKDIFIRGTVDDTVKKSINEKKNFSEFFKDKPLGELV